MSANDELQAHTCEKIMEFYEKTQDYVKKSHNVEENEPKSEKNLTEQWKRDELKERHYYLKDNEYIFIDYFNGVKFEETCDFEIKEVLAPVPSYEEWQKLKEHCRVLKEALTNHEEIRNGLYNECDNLEKENQKLENKRNFERQLYKGVLSENQKLKDLLKECREVFNRTAYTHRFDMVAKIDEVLK